MKLVMDYVTNHWGVSHWMIKDLPTKDWIHWFRMERMVLNVLITKQPLSLIPMLLKLIKNSFRRLV
jgi:hypothetical protein